MIKLRKVNNDKGFILEEIETDKVNKKLIDAGANKGLDLPHVEDNPESVQAHIDAVKKEVEKEKEELEKVAEETKTEDKVVFAESKKFNSRKDLSPFLEQLKEQQIKHRVVPLHEDAEGYRFEVKFEKPLVEQQLKESYETAFEVCKDGSKVMAVGSFKDTRMYRHELVDFECCKGKGHGDYRWMNRPWERFTFAQALQEAMISAGIDSAFAKKCIDNSGSLRDAIKYFADNFACEEPEVKECIKEDKECFFEIVFKEKDDEEEKTERYEDDFDGARADFLHMTQDERDNYQYVVLRKVCTDYNSEEDIEIIDSFGLDESLVEKKGEQEHYKIKAIWKGMRDGKFVHEEYGPYDVKAKNAYLACKKAVYLGLQNLWDFDYSEFTDAMYDRVSYEWDTEIIEGPSKVKVKGAKESLEEAKEEPKLETYEEQIDFLVKDEDEAIAGYDKVLALVEDENVKEQLQHLKEEEIAHKEFLEILKKDPSAKYEHKDDEEEPKEDEPEDDDDISAFKLPAEDEVHVDVGEINWDSLDEDLDDDNEGTTNTFDDLDEAPINDEVKHAPTETQTQINEDVEDDDVDVPTVDVTNKAGDMWDFGDEE